MYNKHATTLRGYQIHMCPHSPACSQLTPPGLHALNMWQGAHFYQAICTESRQQCVFIYRLSLNIINSFPYAPVPRHSVHPDAPRLLNVCFILTTWWPKTCPPPTRTLHPPRPPYKGDTDLARSLSLGGKSGINSGTCGKKQCNIYTLILIYTKAARDMHTSTRCTEFQTTLSLIPNAFIVQRREQTQIKELQ